MQAIGGKDNYLNVRDLQRWARSDCQSCALPVELQPHRDGYQYVTASALQTIFRGKPEKCPLHQTGNLISRRVLVNSPCVGVHPTSPRFVCSTEIIRTRLAQEDDSTMNCGWCKSHGNNRRECRLRAFDRASPTTPLRPRHRLRRRRNRRYRRSRFRAGSRSCCCLRGRRPTRACG
jgi:hypothetical protein